MSMLDQLRKDIVSASRILSHLRLVEGFGHVSARIPGSDRFLITPRISLALGSEEQLLILNLKGEVIEGGSFSASLGRSPLFPPLLVHMIGVGEESGSLDSCCRRSRTSMRARSKRRCSR